MISDGMEEFFPLGRTFGFHFVHDGLETLSGKGLAAGMQVESLARKAGKHRAGVGQP